MTDSKRPLPTGEKEAEEPEDDAGALGARLLLSAVAIAVFVALGWWVTDLWTPPARPAFEFGGDAAPPVTADVPAPPASELSLRYAGVEGRYRRYESDLSRPEVVDFYTRALTGQGWRMDAQVEQPAAGGGPVQAVRAFTRGAARCIIAAEEKARAGTAVTVLIVPLARPEGGVARRTENSAAGPGPSPAGRRSGIARRDNERDRTQ